MPDIKTIFETERLVVRQVSTDDYENFNLLHSNPEIMQFIAPVKTQQQNIEFVNKAIAGNSHTYLGRWVVIEKSTGLFVGSFVIIPIPGDEDNIQLGYVFLKEHWGKGFATEVTKGGLHYFSHHTPLQELYAVIEATNHASEKVLIKAGFTFFSNKKKEGKDLKVFRIERNKYCIT